MTRGVPRFVHWSIGCGCTCGGWCRRRIRRGIIVRTSGFGGTFPIFPNKLLPEAVAMIVDVDG